MAATAIRSGTLLLAVSAAPAQEARALAASITLTAINVVKALRMQRSVMSQPFALASQIGLHFRVASLEWHLLDAKGKGFGRPEGA
jgi:hypothetical protein